MSKRCCWSFLEGNNVLRIECGARGSGRVRMFNTAPSAIDQRDFSLKCARDVIRYIQASLSVSHLTAHAAVFDNDNCLIYLKLCRVPWIIIFTMCWYKILCLMIAMRDYHLKIVRESDDEMMKCWDASVVLVVTLLIHWIMNKRQKGFKIHGPRFLYKPLFNFYIAMFYTETPKTIRTIAYYT